MIFDPASKPEISREAREFAEAKIRAAEEDKIIQENKQKEQIKAKRLQQEVEWVGCFIDWNSKLPYPFSNFSCGINAGINVRLCSECIHYTFLIKN